MSDPETTAAPEAAAPEAAVGAVPAPAGETPAVPAEAAPAEAAPIGPIVAQATRDPQDAATHVERINPGDNPAHIPGTRRDPEDVPQPSGLVRLYRLTMKAFHGGRLYRAGELIELPEDQAGPHHVLVEPR